MVHLCPPVSHKIDQYQLQSGGSLNLQLLSGFGHWKTPAEGLGIRIDGSECNYLWLLP